MVGQLAMLEIKEKHDLEEALCKANYSRELLRERLEQTSMPESARLDINRYLQFLTESLHRIESLSKKRDEKDSN